MQEIYFMIVQRGTEAKTTCKDYKNNNGYKWEIEYANEIVMMKAGKKNEVVLANRNAKQ